MLFLRVLPASLALGFAMASAHATPECVTLDGAMQVCRAPGVHNLSQGDDHLIGLGLADPETGFITGMGVEIAKGCRFGHFAQRYNGWWSCRMAPLDKMAARWAQEFLSTDDPEQGGIGRMKLLDVAPVTLAGHPGYLARYRSDFSHARRLDTWHGLFMTEVSGRHFLVNGFDISAQGRFDRMKGQIETVLKLLKPVGEAASQP